MWLPSTLKKVSTPSGSRKHRQCPSIISKSPTVYPSVDMQGSYFSSPLSGNSSPRLSQRVELHHFITVGDQGAHIIRIAQAIYHPQKAAITHTRGFTDINNEPNTPASAPTREKLAAFDCIIPFSFTLEDWTYPTNITTYYITKNNSVRHCCFLFLRYIEN